MTATVSIPTIAQKIASLLVQSGLTLGLAESASGGLISSWFTGIPGSSAFFQGSVVAYANEAKVHLLGVKQSSIDAFGAVSAQVAEEMARGALDRFYADCRYRYRRA